MNGKIATLNKFVSQVTDKCLPFFSTLKRSFEWTDECQQVFENLKLYLSSPPLLSPSRPGEELYLYLVVSQAAVNATLIREEDGSQRPVYFASRASRREIPPNGEVGLRISNRGTKAQAILLGTYHHSLDGSAPEKSHE